MGDVGAVEEEVVDGLREGEREGEREERGVGGQQRATAGRRSARQRQRGEVSALGKAQARNIVRFASRQPLLVAASRSRA